MNVTIDIDELKEVIRELIKEELRLEVYRGTWDNETAIRLVLEQEMMFSHNPSRTIVSSDTIEEGKGRREGR